MEGCGTNCIKYLLVVFNAIFMIFGIVIIAAAGVDLGLINGFAAIKSEGYETDILLIIIGVFILLIAAFGCFGAWTENTKFLYIFAGALILIILLELSVGIAAAALRPQIEDNMKKQIRESFIKNKANNNGESNHRQFWDRIQSTLGCCGITGPDDYAAGEPRVNPSFSCCPIDVNDVSQQVECLNKQNYYKEGCETKVLNTLHSGGMTVIVCGLLFCFLEVAGIVLALWLAQSIKNSGKTRESA